LCVDLGHCVEGASICPSLVAKCLENKHGGEGEP
jgi:hypothetical protein